MLQAELNQQRDRRVFERICISLPLTLIDLDTNRELEARTCDVSAKGLGIVSNKSLASQDRLELWLHMPDEKDPLYTRGTVVWARPEEGGEQRIGVSLERAELMGMSRVFRR